MAPGPAVGVAANDGRVGAVDLNIAFHLQA